MSYWHGSTPSTVDDTFAGGVGSIGDIYAAARDQMLYVDNTYSSVAALDRAIEERNDEVFAATGTRPNHPFRRSFADTADLGRGGRTAEQEATRALGAWQAEIATIAGRIPDGSVAERLGRSIESDAIRIARESDAGLAARLESRPGLSKWIGALAGGVVGAMHDPLQVTMLIAGGGPGAGRTVAARLLSASMREMLVNGAAEAALQPQVQAWREKAGLDHGTAEALKNIGFAAAFGGALGFLGQGGGEAAARLTGRGLDAASAAGATDPALPATTRSALAGEPAAARELAPPVREALPPEARGALDHAEILDHAEQLRPRAVDPELHDRAIAAAHRAAETAEPVRLPVNEQQIQRVAAEMLPKADPAAPRPQSLVEFLAARGVIDHAGELEAIGAGRLARKPRGKTDTRLPLDAAREIAEEAGYIGRAGETQTTTVADLLDAIDTELRGSRVYSREDVSRAGEIDGIEAERAHVESVVAQVAELAGPGIDDTVLRRAAELALTDGIDPGDALERTLMAADAPVRATDAGEASGDPLPGWSDAELEAAAAEQRGMEPFADPQSPFDDPGKVDEEFGLTPAELEEFGGLEIPGDGGPMRLSDLAEEIAADGEMAAIVKACRVG